MASLIEIFQNVMAKFGKKELEAGDTGKLDMYLAEAKTLKLSEFDEKIRVEGVKSTVDRDTMTPEYRKLDRSDAERIQVLFNGITEGEFNKYKEVEGCEGISSGGEPFKCYATLDGNGNLIVTPNKLIEIDNKDNENGTYSETRKQKDGTFATATFKKTHGDITSCSFSRRSNLTQEQSERYHELRKYYQNPNNIQKLEMMNMGEQEKIANVQQLQRMGIPISKYVSPEEMSKQEYEEAKSKGRFDSCCSQSSYFVRDGIESFSSASCMFRDGEDTPDKIWHVSCRDGELSQFKSYKKMENGKYVDATSFQIVNGKPTYRIVEYAEIVKEMESMNIKFNQFYALRDKMEKDLQNEFPKEAERINDHTSRRKDEQERNTGEDSPYPSIPTDR